MKGLITALALVLFLGLFVFQNTAYAAGEDTAPPLEGVTDETTQEGEQPSAEPETDGKIPYIPPEGAFTPDGSADILDHIIDGNKEFYTFTTPAGNVFYLVIDHIRDQENVYFLNAVTEADLVALAQKDNGKSGVSAIPTPPAETEQPEASPSPGDEKPAEPKETDPNAMDSGTIIFIVIAVAVMGIAGYYFKIVKGKQKASERDTEDEYEDEPKPKRSNRYDEDDDGFDDEDAED